MPFYFAFGSNMDREQLESRVGHVVDHGWAVLEEHRHGFTKRGRDGTGKGNIQPRPGCEVHGVLYELTEEQLEVLEGFEPGYDRIELTVRTRGEHVLAASFRAPEWTTGLGVTEAYIDRYRRGMAQHELPEAYVREILASAADPAVSS